MSTDEPKGIVPADSPMVQSHIINQLMSASPTFQAIVKGAMEAGAQTDPVVLIGLLCQHLDGRPPNEGRAGPPPGCWIGECPTDTVDPKGFRAMLGPGGEQVAYGRTYEECESAAWDERERIAAAWHLGLNAERDPDQYEFPPSVRATARSWLEEQQTIKRGLLAAALQEPEDSLPLSQQGWVRRYRAGRDAYDQAGKG